MVLTKLIEIMGQARAAGIEFTGQGSITVKEFLGRMEWWFTTRGDSFNGETEKSKKMRVGQLHLACPIRSDAGRFISTLDKAMLGARTPRKRLGVKVTLP